LYVRALDTSIHTKSQTIEGAIEEIKQWYDRISREEVAA
jgi:hypothetical protein